RARTQLHSCPFLQRCCGWRRVCRQPEKWLGFTNVPSGIPYPVDAMMSIRNWREGRRHCFCRRTFSVRHLLVRLLLMLALISAGAAVWAAGTKVGQTSITGQFPKPVNPGKSATFTLSLNRDNHNGSTGSFVATLTYGPITPGVTYSTSN